MAVDDAANEFSDAEPIDAQIDIKSTWQSYLPAQTSSTMNTPPIPTEIAQVQTTNRAAIGVQTGQDQVQAVKATGLGGFMESVMSLVTSEMKKVEEEHEILEPLNRIVDKAQEPAACIFELTAFSDLGLPAGDSAAKPSSAAAARSKLVVTSLSWSSTGQTVAAAYGRYDIPGWCEDRGALVTWNLARENVNQTRPDITIDVDNCLMSCAFHPEHPALIAGGTFNGDLYVWDLSMEGDTQRAKTDALCQLRHREPILEIVWQYSSTEYNKYGNKTQAYRLVTLGADGQVLIWIWHKLETPLYGYKLNWPQPGSSQKIVYGGSCLSLQEEPKQTNLGSIATFMVGSEGGRIFKCYMDMNDTALKEFAKAAAAGERIDLRCPIQDANYSAHAGAVYGLDCSPFQRDFFLTAGYDGCIHLYHALKPQHLLEVVPTNGPLYGIQWSPIRPMVFAAASGDGRVFFYDLLRVKGMVTPVLAMEASPDGQPTYALAFNTKRPELFATAGASGIQVWRLPESLCDLCKGEEAMLRKLAAADDIEDALRGLRSDDN